MKINNLTVPEVFESFRTGEQGLTREEAHRRLSEFGPNSISKPWRKPLLVRLLAEFTHFFAVILWFAAGLAFMAELRAPGEGMATLGVAIVAVIFINGFFSFWQEYRAEKAVSALQKLLPYKVKVRRSHGLQEVPAEELVPGDLLLLEEGDLISADCRLVESYGVRVDNATVTGESVPVARDAEPDHEMDLLQSHNTVLAGTSMVSGQATAVVFATGGHSEFGKIAHLTQQEHDVASPLQEEIARVSRLVAVLASALGAIFFLIGSIIGLSFWQCLTFAIGIIVANVPEGLLPTVTLALAFGSQRMAKRNVLIRHLPAVETLGCTSVICTDKTGTLTQNKMAVRGIFVNGQEMEISPEIGINSQTMGQRAFFYNALLCQNLKESLTNREVELVGDPMEAALVRMARQALTELPHFQRVDEISFDSDRKRLSTLYRTLEGFELYTKGAPETVLPLCTHIEIHGEVKELTPECEAALLAAQERMTSHGLRVLALAYRRLPDMPGREHLEEQMVISGLVGLEDPPRREVPEAILKCREAGVRVIMVTGDHPLTGAAIAREIGLVTTSHPTIVTGEQLYHMTDIQLQVVLDAREIIFARVAADQKMRIVAALKRKGQVVAVTGDGVNDAPALKKADIGIAMGKSGTDVAREAADVVLLDDNFASIVAGIEEGRAVFANIRKFLTYILTSNIPELVPYLAFALFRIPLPLTVIQILAVDLGTDMLPALGLGAEPPRPEVMQQPPRDMSERLLGWRTILRAYCFLGMVESLAAMSAFFFVLHQGKWRYGQFLPADAPLYLRATTACLSTIIVMQVCNVFLCRSNRELLVTAKFPPNPLIYWGVVVEIMLILLVDYTPWGNTLFGTAPIGLQVWLFAIPFGIAMLILDEARKWLVLRMHWHEVSLLPTSKRKLFAIAPDSK